jgi:hypothetical protein
MTDASGRHKHAISLAGGKWRWIVESGGEAVSAGHGRLDTPVQLNRIVASRNNERRQQDDHRNASGMTLVYRLQRRFHWPSGVAADDEIRFAMRLAPGHVGELALDGQPLTLALCPDRWWQSPPVISGHRNAAAGAHVLELVFDERSGRAATEGELVPEVELRIFAGHGGKP